MKMTNELLDKLIAEEINRIDEKQVLIRLTNVPSEKNISALSKQLGLRGANALPGKAKKDQASALKSLTKAGDTDGKDISDDDIKAAVKAGGLPLDTLASIRQKSALPKLPSEIEAEFEKAVSAVDAEAGVVTDSEMLKVTPLDVQQVQSYTFPRVMTSDSNIQKGIFLGSQNELMRSIFSKGTIKGRLEEMSEISQKVMRAEASDDNAKKLLQYAMFIDLCNFYINESDTRSGGYLFEALCAQVCGGIVGGGANGVADFETAAGSKGSSKLYSDWSGIKQSVSDETWKAGEAIHYVIGLKEKVQVSEELREGEKYVGVNLYYIIVTKESEEVETDAKGEEVKVGRFVTSGPKGNILSIQKLPIKRGSIVDVIKGANPDDAFVGKLEIYSGPNSYKQVIDRDLKEGTNTKKAFAATEKFFKLLFDAEENTKKYIATSDPDVSLKAGEQAEKDYNAAGPLLNEILSLLKIEQTETIKENKQKLSEELLDKLIKAVILES